MKREGMYVLLITTNKNMKECEKNCLIIIFERKGMVILTENNFRKLDRIIL